LRKPGKNPVHNELLQARIAELKSRIPTGGVREAAVRALLYVGATRRAVDVREFEIVRRIRREQQATQSVPLPAFKNLVREQFYMLLLDEEAALAAIPKMLQDDAALRRQAFDLIKRVLSASGGLGDEERSRLTRIAGLFALDTDAMELGNITALPARDMRSRAS